ncbi:uncharacterized protein [Drosophila virilis]|uniref:Uncharacterized protein n=1 Tax=Drosophila virilis TaxID=7244 RepID=B4LBV6_DROVI|nr:uncharacterized protein LOC6624118 [Drosophila virilis]EDW69756.1 uncharacterized protein Dvir_GJ13426 [Drosophila virilis]
MTETAPDADGCANEIGATDDICVVEMLQPNDTVTNNKLHNSSSSSRSRRLAGGERTAREGHRRRCSVGGKCIWPASDWLRKLRNKEPQPQHQHQEQEQLPRESHSRRGSVLLMVLLSGSEMEAKAVVVSEQQAVMRKSQPQRLARSATDDMEEAIDALWL